jgi:hypothetical protein
MQSGKNLFESQYLKVSAKHNSLFRANPSAKFNFMNHFATPECPYSVGLDFPEENRASVRFILSPLNNSDTLHRRFSLFRDVSGLSRLDRHWLFGQKPDLIELSPRS